mgnify:FL=1
MRNRLDTKVEMNNNHNKRENESKNKNRVIEELRKHKRVIIMFVLLCVIIYIFCIVAKLIKNPTDTFLVEQGQIYQEEIANGYIIRDEVVVKGENYKNGMSQIKTEGERVAKGEAIFRYYSNGEDNLIKKIEELDKKIDEAMDNENNKIVSSDTKVIENQILEKIESAYNESNLQKIKEYKKDINTYITKKAKITGELSPSGSYLKKLIDQRSNYEKKLNSGAEYIKAPTSGVVSYRVDGYEELLTTKDFGNFTKDFLENLNLKTGQIIAATDESGKIIDNYKCYIATVLTSEYAKKAQVGDSVKIRLPSGNEVSASIEYINAEDNGQYVIIFKITKCVEELINYRKISLNIIWWSYSGKKIPNSAINYEKKGDNEIAYVIRTRAEYQDKILVKKLKSNEKYTIVADYTSEELEKLGYTSEEIKSRKTISLYDEILINK